MVTQDGSTYTSLPEDGALLERQISYTLYRASMFHRPPYSSWRIELTEAEEETLWAELKGTTGFVDVLNREFKGVPIKVLEP